MERSELAHTPTRAPPAARGRTGRQRHTRTEDAVRGEKGESRRRAENWGSRPEKCRWDCGWRTGIDEFTKVCVEQWWRAPIHHQPKTAPDSLRGPDVRPQGRGRSCRACDSSGAKRAGAWLANRPQPAARDRAWCRTPLNHTECAHRRRVRSASSAPWRHSPACLAAWVASASHASAALTMRARMVSMAAGWASHVDVQARGADWARGRDPAAHTGARVPCAGRTPTRAWPRARAGSVVAHRGG